MPTDDSPVRVVVGRVGKAHGIRGAVFVIPLTDEPHARFQPGVVVVAGPPASRSLTVVDARDHSGRLVVEFEGVTNRNAAEALRGSELELDVDPAQLPEGDEEYYDRQLVGLTVIVDGEPVGEVTEVIHLPGQDLLTVRLHSGSEHLVPFVASICPQVNLPEGFVVLDPPVGLLDDEAQEA